MHACHACCFFCKANTSYTLIYCIVRSDHLIRSTHGTICAQQCESAHNPNSRNTASVLLAHPMQSHTQPSAPNHSETCVDVCATSLRTSVIYIWKYIIICRPAPWPHNIGANVFVLTNSCTACHGLNCNHCSSASAHHAAHNPHLPKYSSASNSV